MKGAAFFFAAAERLTQKTSSSSLGSGLGFNGRDNYLLTVGSEMELTQQVSVTHSLGPGSRSSVERVEEGQGGLGQGP